MSQTQEWQLIASDGQQYGPYSAEQMQAYAANGTIVPQTLVWTASLADWVPAAQVEGLIPPQIPQQVLLSSTISPGPQSALANSLQPSQAPGEPCDRGFVSVAWGLRLIFWAVLISFLATLADGVLEGVSSPLADSPIFGFALAGSYLAMITGMALCFRRPRAPMATGVLIAALTLMVLPIVLLFVNAALAVLYIVLLGGVAQLLVMMLIAIYMKVVASHLGKTVLALRAKSFARLVAILVGMAIAAWILIAVMVGSAQSGSWGGVLGGGALLMLGALVFAVMAIVALCLYLRLLQDVRREILWQLAVAKSHAPSPSGVRV